PPGEAMLGERWNHTRSDMRAHVHEDRAGDPLRVAKDRARPFEADEPGPANLLDEERAADPRRRQIDVTAVLCRHVGRHRPSQLPELGAGSTDPLSRRACPQEPRESCCKRPRDARTLTRRPRTA